MGVSPRLGAPSGRGGTDDFWAKRSCLDGSQRVTVSEPSMCLGDHVGRLALQPPRAVVRARVGAVVGLWGDVEAELLEHRVVLLRRVAEGGEEVAEHHAVDAGLDAEALELGDVLDAPAAQAQQRAGQDQPEDRDPLHGLPRVHELAVAELRAGARVEQVDRDGRRVDLGELERHLDALLARLAEVQDPADARLEPRLAHRVDRAQPALVADRRGDLVVVGARGLDVVMHALDARRLERPGAPDAHVADRGAALEIRVLGDQARGLEHRVEVALGEPLPLGDHAEAMRARRLSGAGVLEYLLGRHHRVQGSLRLREPALRAESTVLRASSGLCVHQRAEIRGICEEFRAHPPRAVDQRLDGGVVLELAEHQRLLARDQGRHSREPYGACRTVTVASSP